MARIHQDYAFDVEEANGRELIQLRGLVDLADPDASPIVLFARIGDPLEWHRFFLDAGAAFWETWPDSQIANEHDDDSIRLVDYFATHLPRTILRAQAFRASPKSAARILLELDDGHRIELRTDDDTPDAPSMISLSDKRKDSL